MSSKQLKHIERASLGEHGKPLTVERSVSLQSGPLPSPEILAGYNSAVPGAAERIIAMAERQAAHRIAMETLVIRGDTRRATMGLIIGGIVALAAMATSGFIAWSGHPLSGTLLGGGTILSIVGTFVYGSQLKRHDQAKRQPPNQVSHERHPSPR